MKITVLCDNKSDFSNLNAEHGLSLYLQTNGKNILFDMGQSDLFYKNATMLGIDLSKVDFAVISHGHYDHGGGLEKFLQINTHAPVYVSSYAFEPHFNANKKYIGLNMELKNNKRIVFLRDDYQITPQISIKCASKIKRAFAEFSSNLLVSKNGEFFKDEFLHEQYLLVNEDNKNYLFSGCSHRGVLNIASHFSSDFYVGGMHLSKLDVNADSQILLGICNSLKELSTSFYTCHCTGESQYQFIKKEMRQKINYIGVGNTLNI